MTILTNVNDDQVVVNNNGPENPTIDEDLGPSAHSSAQGTATRYVRSGDEHGRSRKRSLSEGRPTKSYGGNQGLDSDSSGPHSVSSVDSSIVSTSESDSDSDSSESRSSDDCQFKRKKRKLDTHKSSSLLKDFPNYILLNHRIVLKIPPPKF